MQIPQEKRFHFHDGSSAGSIEELKEKLEKLPYDEFYEHVNEEKNDFASWIEHVVENKSLADKLQQVASIVETVELLNEELHTPPQHDEDYEDLQARIEEKLFSDMKPQTEWTSDDEPQETMSEEPEKLLEGPEDAAKVEQTPESEDEPQETVEEPKQPQEESLSDELVHDKPEIEFPSKEELEGEKTPGEPVTTQDDSHKPITAMVQEQPPHPDHMKFVVKQFIFGFVIGLIAGLILARLIPMPL